MEFEYDPAKSATNKDKHGIDFDDAQALWHDDKRVSLSLSSQDEQRFIVIGLIGEKLWTAICTMRGDAVRIISVRRARKYGTAYHENDIRSRT